MQLVTQRENTYLIVRPPGERLDADVAVEFREQLAGYVRDGQTRILLDLGEVQFLDSSGLGAIVSIRKMLGDGGELTLCAVRDTVMSMFQLTRMDRVFTIYDTREDATAVMSTS